MAATLQLTIFAGGTALTAYLTRISGDVPAVDGYALTHASDVYTGSIARVGRYVVRCRKVVDGPNYFVGYVDLVDGQTCEPVDTLAELDASVSVNSLATAILDAATASVEDNGPPIVIPPASTAGQCNCVLDVINVHKQPLVGATLTAMPKGSPTWVGSQLMHPTNVPPTSNEAGRITVSLAQATAYRISVKHNDQTVSFDFTTPSASSAQIQTVTL